MNGHYLILMFGSLAKDMMGFDVVSRRHERVVAAIDVTRTTCHWILLVRGSGGCVTMEFPLSAASCARAAAALLLVAIEIHQATGIPIWRAIAAAQATGLPLFTRM